MEVAVEEVEVEVEVGLAAGWSGPHLAGKMGPSF